jgi:hypothetical protein
VRRVVRGGGPALIDRLQQAYEIDIVQAGKAAQFWLLVAFVVTFLATRAVTTVIARSNVRVRRVLIRDIHVHHLVPGILLMTVVGYLAIGRGWSGIWPAVLFGAGAALTLDEFALWLHLEDVYWTDRGRHSVRVVIGTASVAALLLVHIDFWNRAAGVLGELIGR